MSKYPLIADHGLIGDLQTSALVATDGTIDWFCSPRFDSPSIFGSLLDSERGGHFSARPRDDAFETKQLYFPDTAILITRFLTDSGVGEVIDFMPATSEAPSEPAPSRPADPVRPRDDRVRHRGRSPVRLRAHSRTRSTHRRRRRDLHRRRHHPHAEPHPESRRRTARRRLERSDDGDLHVLAQPRRGPDARRRPGDRHRNAPARLPVAVAQRLFDDTAHFWQDWVGQSDYTGRWREELERSAITLKLLTYAPTGRTRRRSDRRACPSRSAGSATGTTATPGFGMRRSPSTRWCRMGYFEEATAFGLWLRDRVAESGGQRHRPAEHHVPHRRGPGPVRGDPSRSGRATAARYPVRIGNGAAGQLQLDIYGEAIDAIWTRQPRGRRDRPARLGGDLPAARLARRQLGSARRGHLGDPRRPQGLHVRAPHVLGGLRPRDPARDGARPAGAARPVDQGARRDLQPDHGEGMERRASTRSCSSTARPSSTPRC